MNTHENLADLFTKPLSGPKRIKLVRMVLHHVFPEKDNGDTVGDYLGLRESRPFLHSQGLELPTPFYDLHTWCDVYISSWNYS